MKGYDQRLMALQLTDHQQSKACLLQGAALPRTETPAGNGRSLSQPQVCCSAEAGVGTRPCHGHTPPGALLGSACFSPTAQGDGSPLPQSASGNTVSRPSWPEYRSVGFGSDTFIHVWSVWATGSHGWAGGPAPETWSPVLEAGSLRGRCR